MPAPTAWQTVPVAATYQRRWSGSAWMALRGGMGLESNAGAGQLGGSQAGARIAYAIDAAHRLAVVGRVTAPLHARGSEAAVALEWQPTPVPVRAVVERRFALDGVPAGFGIGLVGGVDALPLAAGFTLEGYGQAGGIERDRMEPYADGAARATHPLGHPGGVAVRLGGGVWGAAQRGAARLDVGPTLTAAIPIGERSLRLLADWRQRVAGDARPGSGPSLTLASDF